MVEFTSCGIQINNQEIPFYSGSFHYWRSAKENWGRILDNILEMGFQIVETYIPWSVHEISEGCFDFGEIRKENDLDGFLTLCEQKGLYVIVRPGPHINAEMKNFGYPEWIVNDPEIAAKNPWNTEVVYPYVTGPFAILSYCSSKFYEKVHLYFKQLEPILKKHASPNGNIIAIQADNETCNFFRDNPYIMDYSEESIALYKQYLSEKFSTVSRMNGKLHTQYDNFEAVKAPAGYDGTNYLECQEWVQYKEAQILYSIQKTADFIQEMDLKIPVFHNCAYQTYTPVSLQRDERLEGLSLAGIDAYPEGGSTAMLKQRIRFMSGSSRLAYVPEFGSGSWFDREYLLSAEEERFAYLYSFMNGLKAINYYMLVERNRWTGCPITNNGQIRKDYFSMFQAFNHFLLAHHIWQDCRKPEVLILQSYDMGRIKALSHDRGVNMLSSNCFVKGIDIPDSLFSRMPQKNMICDEKEEDITSEHWLECVMEYLDGLCVEYDISDMYIGEEKLFSYEVVFASAYTIMSEESQKLLQRFAANSSKKIFIGPVIPEYTEYMEESSRLSHIKCLKEEELNQAEEDILPLQKVQCLEKGIELSLHQTGEQDVYHLYVANTAEKEKEFVIDLKEAYAVRALSDVCICIVTPVRIRLILSPRSVEIIELKKGKNHDS